MLQLVGMALSVLLSAAAPAVAQNYPETRLRVIGGLASVTQYVRHEEPFWTRRLPELTRGAVRAQIAPFDRSGIRATELFQLVRLGVAPFATVLLAQMVGDEPEFGAIDLPGLNPDMASLRSSVAAFRPRIERAMRERYGIELLAVYAYPAQVLFCVRPFQTLADLHGRRIRTAAAAQANFVEALGAVPVVIPFAATVENVRGGVVDCAITGTMSGNSVGLHEVTSHVSGMAISWGIGVFLANGDAWRGLAEPVRALLGRELPRLEAEIWESAERETGEGLACNAGASECVAGRRGRMTVVPPTAADTRQMREVFRDSVLPRWVDLCGAECARAWNATLAPTTGIAARE
jgi:TRAP-type C4-dicarboxylate transport system substrate-binding protein